jgi:putative FmdB family regulatory protein
MPIYAYKCSTCGHAKDVLQKISDAPLTVCPACGADAFTKQVTAAGFQLKGSGWYATDFRNGSKPKPAEDGKPAEGAKPSESGDSKPAETAAKPAEGSTKSADTPAKPADKAPSKPDAPAASAGARHGAGARH